MNFKDFYYKTENRLIDSILSLWATGDAEMQHYFSSILKSEKEKLLAEPVFQNSFPWEASNKKFSDTNSIFSDVFINALDKVKNEDYRFPKERNPYKHQVESWDALINQNKSIAVTTGTGSGKTECFMLPVLYDVFTNCKDSVGINAIFLYPLNALIGSQKKRVNAWCKALGGVKYAVYNGNTNENVQANEANKALPELISRKQIRETPPQILFTNPSMLEYILVRNKDVQLLKNSEGKLRWILLDEAHTLKGSSAAEMALLIRRIVDAFKVDVRLLRFAITSATVGQGEDTESQLKKFMAHLCGISEKQILVISGNRVLPELPQPFKASTNLVEIRDSPNPENFNVVQKLRTDLINNPALPLSNIGNRFQINNPLEQLGIVDFLSERKVDKQSLLPVRGHFFARGIGGVYICTNPLCEEHKGLKPPAALGTITTIAGTLCKCGSPFLELVACRSCGNQLIEGEKFIDKNTGDEKVRLIAAITQEAFTIEDIDEEDGDMVTASGKCYFTRKFENAKYVTQGLEYFSISKEGNVVHGEDFIEAIIDGEPVCPHCSESTNNPMHFRLSASFINRILSDIFLEETPESENQTKDMLWRGHKYISFTDSRQGTAKIAAFINQDTEARWIRSQVYHRLCEKKNEWDINNPEIAKEELIEIIAQLEEEIASTTIPALKIKKIKDRQEYMALLNGSENKVSVGISWEEIKKHINPLSEFNTLFIGNNPNDANQNKSHYLDALLYDQFARRLPRERSLENLGMVSLGYPGLHNATLPSIAESFKINIDEWKSLLKISLDYIIRFQFCFFVNSAVYPYSTSFIRSQAIFSSDSDQVNIKKWPTFNRHHIRPNRLSLLICAGLGYTERNDIDNNLEDRINDLLETIWRTLKTSVLSLDGTGFKLDIDRASQFQLSEKLWLCPVKKRLIDAHFRGYSPWIKGSLTNENIRHYKLEKVVKFPDLLMHLIEIRKMMWI